MTAPAPSVSLTAKDQAAALLGHVAGYVGHRTIAMGLRHGLVEALAAEPDGMTAAELAERLSLDPFYVSVWCRGAVASGVCDQEAEHYRLAPHMGTLLLDVGSPAYMGGVFPLFLQREMFGRFDDELPTGERLWWNECSPEWIAGVQGTGTPFYTRLIPGGLEQIPGLGERLATGGRIVDTACGAGVGLVRLAQTYPASPVVGVDGDEHSVREASKRVESAGLTERVTLVHSPLEEMRIDEPAALVVNNISMHECRDIDAVTERVRDALEPGGWFAISDFPFPQDVEGLRKAPGRVMCGIQYFEAQIDDQLLPRAAYDDLLARHGFSETGSFFLTPMHAVTYGRRRSGD